MKHLPWPICLLPVLACLLFLVSGCSSSPPPDVHHHVEAQVQIIDREFQEDAEVTYSGHTMLEALTGLGRELGAKTQRERRKFLLAHIAGVLVIAQLLFDQLPAEEKELVDSLARETLRKAAIAKLPQGPRKTL